MLSIEKLIEQELSEPNYLIESDENYTAIYFSGNGLFNDIETFERNIVEKNEFEFYKTRIEKAVKHIFIRDIKKIWYSQGINNELNSVETLLELLKKETKGSKVITIGSSAGGFAAMLFGILLSAEYIFSFSGRFIIPAEINSKYNLLEMVRSSDIPIFYMTPYYSERDRIQCNLVKDFSNVYVLALKSFVHGVPIFKGILKKIINSGIADLKRMYSYKNKPIGERIFVIKYWGFFRFFSRMIKKNVICTVNKYFIKDLNKKVAV